MKFIQNWAKIDSTLWADCSFLSPKIINSGNRGGNVKQTNVRIGSTTLTNPSDTFQFAFTFGRVGLVSDASTIDPIVRRLSHCSFSFHLHWTVFQTPSLHRPSFVGIFRFTQSLVFQAHPRIFFNLSNGVRFNLPFKSKKQLSVKCCDLTLTKSPWIRLPSLDWRSYFCSHFIIFAPPPPPLLILWLLLIKMSSFLNHAFSRSLSCPKFLSSRFRILIFRRLIFFLNVWQTLFQLIFVHLFFAFPPCLSQLHPFFLTFFHSSPLSCFPLHVQTFFTWLSNSQSVFWADFHVDEWNQFSWTRFRDFDTPRPGW